MKKIKISSEAVYFAAIIILSLAVAMITCTDFGVSMIVAPAYILSLKFEFLSFGQAEYIIQALLFIIFCILMKRVRLSYFFSFITGIIYGAVLDLWRIIIPHFNPHITPAGSLPFSLRCVYFVLGMVITSFSIALFFNTYIYPQVYDFFVKDISKHFSLNRARFKTAFDVSFLILSVILTLLLFKGIKGIGVGTIIMTCLNGILIGFFGKLIDRYFEITPKAIKFARLFEI